MATPGGYASKDEREARADKMRRLAEEGLSPSKIALRVGLSPSKVREDLCAMGLRKSGERTY
jgi:hypothetical protein